MVAGEDVVGLTQEGLGFVVPVLDGDTELHLLGPAGSEFTSVGDVYVHGQQIISVSLGEDEHTPFVLC